MLAPDLIYPEFGNILWKLHRFQGLSQSEAERSLTEFQTINFAITPSFRLLNDAYQIASSYQRTVYDSLYIALSLRQECPLITAHEKLVKSVAGIFPSVQNLDNWI